MKQSSNTPLPRRHFLQQLMVLGGATSAGAIAFVSAGYSVEQAPAKQVTTETSTPTKGYRLTEHIRTYYEKAQI